MKQLVKVQLLLAIIILSNTAFGQNGWNWGDQPDIAKEKNALYTDLYKAGKYMDAVPSLEWLLANTPDLNLSLYQNGVKIYDGLQNSESDATKRKEYRARSMELYDLRIKYFGDEANVLNRKVYPAYKYYKDDKSKYGELLDMYRKAFKLNGDKIYENNLIAYMDIVRRYKVTGGDISDQEIIDTYFQITSILEMKCAKKPSSRCEKNMDILQKMLLGTVDVNCEFVENNLGPKLAQTGEVKLAKQIFGLLLTNKCTDSPLALKAAEIVNESEPDYGIAKFIAGKSYQDKNAEKAIEFYEKAVALTDDNVEKSEIYISIAKVYVSKSDKVSARNSARRSLAFDPSMKEAYKLIGDLYMTSYEDCKGGEFKVVDRGVFMAAYKMYARAGDTQSMESAKGQFPSIEDIFNENYEEGQSMKVGCWINESVQIERRPN